MLNYNLVVVGAGMAGATYARVRAEQYNERVLVIDQRLHVGGNCYDHYETGFGLVHSYGPHLFHTNSPKVVDFLSQFTGWISYEHRVQVEVDGQRLPLPVNYETIERLFPTRLAEHLISKLNQRWKAGTSLSLLDLEVEAKREKSDPVFVFLYDMVFNKVFKPYSEKQWGTPIEEVDGATLRRVPIRLSYDDRYFTDKFQCLPTEGYTSMFTNMLNHPNINIMLGTSFAEIEKFWDPSTTRLFWTGSIDQLNGYRHGPLPYRSLDFHQALDAPLPVGTVNLPNDMQYTRVTDQSLINRHGVDGLHVLTYEAPKAHDHNDPTSVPYYPVASGKYLYDKYEADVKASGLPIVCGGRLGSFQYLNIDQACAQALTLADYQAQ